MICRKRRLERERLLVAVRESNRLSRCCTKTACPVTCKSSTPSANLFDAEVALAQVQREELLAVVRLYLALGGGWQ